MVLGEAKTIKDSPSCMTVILIPLHRIQPANKDDEFLSALRTGKTPERKQLSDAMPWKAFTYTDNELKAIYLYLHQLK